MKGFKNIIFADKIIKISATASVLMIFFMIVVGLFFISRMPPIVPVFNQMPWGDLRLGSRVDFFIPAISSLLFFIVNLLFAYYIYSKMPLVSRTLSISGLLIVFLAMIFVIRTIQLIY